jgi:Lipocalin-like domain
MKRALYSAAVAVAVTSLLWTSTRIAAFETQTSQRQGLSGVWALVSLQDLRPNGEALDWMGKNPSGVLIYSPDGRMTLQIMRDPRPSTAAPIWSSDGHDLLPSASASEIRDAYRGYYAYFGTWDIDQRAHTVTHHVRASLRSSEVDSHYVRPFEVSGEQLQLRYPVSAPDGERRTRILIWRRVERF